MAKFNLKKLNERMKNDIIKKVSSVQNKNAIVAGGTVHRGGCNCGGSSKLVVR